MKPRRALGFTILEMLVVLVIVGMVSSILFQALDQVYRLQSRFGIQLAQSQQGEMYVEWFRQVVQGLQTDFSNGKETFQGKESEFTGTTTSSLSADYGEPTTVTLSLQYDTFDNVTELSYTSNSRKMKLFSWPGKQARRFIYLDANGDPHDTWPPPFGIWPQLPNLILLQYQRDGEPQLIAAVPRGTREPKVRPIVFGGSAF